VYLLDKNQIDSIPGFSISIGLEKNGGDEKASKSSPEQLNNSLNAMNKAQPKFKTSKDAFW